MQKAALPWSEASFNATALLCSIHTLSWQVKAKTQPCQISASGKEATAHSSWTQPSSSPLHWLKAIKGQLPHSKLGGWLFYSWQLEPYISLESTIDSKIQELSICTLNRKYKQTDIMHFTNLLKTVDCWLLEGKCSFFFFFFVNSGKRWQTLFLYHKTQPEPLLERKGLPPNTGDSVGTSKAWS